MFCLMDTSASMTEHMKDLAKRFFALLYIFLKRRYRHVEVVFIRHTHEAAEVDEDTFFHSTETGGTIVSSALEEMIRIVRARFPREDWNIYAAQASDGDNSSSDSESTADAADQCRSAGLPVFRLHRGRRREPGRLAWASSRARRISGAPTRRSARRAPSFAMCKVRHRNEIYPGVPRAVRAQRRQGRSGRRMSLATSDQLLFQRRRVEFLAPSRRIHDACGAIAEDEFGLDVYPNQIEIITTEQMLDAYSSIGMPQFYKHWSFGKNFATQESHYRKGLRGLAYEIVINSNPCISYIMEENTATMQTLVIAHAAFGHNHFFKNNYLFKQWTDAEGILHYLEFAKGFIAECEERLRPHCRRAAARRRPQPDEPRRASLPAQAEAGSPLRRPAGARAAACTASRCSTTSGAPCRRAARRARDRISTRSDARCSNCPRRTSSTSSRRPRRACSPGSGRSCASSASSRSTSIRRARPS